MVTIKKSTLISIIVPVHNSGEFLDECLESIVKQTYRSIEIILVNDNSKDDSEKKIKEWLKKDARIDYISVNYNNAALTRSEGIERAKGEYTCFLDSDDIIGNRYIETLFDAVKDGVSDIATVKIAAFRNIDSISTIPIGSGGHEVASDLCMYFFDHYLWNSRGDFIAQSINAKIFKRELLKDIDYSVLKTSILEDNYIVPQILRASKSQTIVLVDKVLYYYRQNQNSTMANALASNIKYGDHYVSYPELFKLTMKYVKNLFADYEQIDNLANKLEAIIYFDFSQSLAKALRLSEEKLITSERRTHSLIKEVDDHRKKLGDITNSKSYKIGTFVVLPYRKFKSKR